MTDKPAAAAIGVRDLLRIPDFRRLYLAQSISDIGDGMTYLALFLLVLDLTGSTAAIALMSILVALPPVTVGLFAGAWADRHDRRRIMIASDRLRALVVLGIVVAAIGGSRARAVRSRCVQSIIGTFFSPARMAMVPRVVPEDGLLAANSLGQATRMVASVIGAAVTGVIAAIAGVAWPVLVVDAATFLVSVVLVFGVAAELGRPDAVAVGQGQDPGPGRRRRRRPAPHRPLGVARRRARRRVRGRCSASAPSTSCSSRSSSTTSARARPGPDPLEGAQTLSMILAGGLMAASRRGSACPGCSSAARRPRGLRGPARDRPRPVGAARCHVRRRLVRDAGAGDDDDDRPAGDDQRDPRPGRRARSTPRSRRRRSVRWRRPGSSPT